MVEKSNLGTEPVVQLLGWSWLERVMGLTRPAGGGLCVSGESLRITAMVLSYAAVWAVFVFAVFCAGLVYECA